MVMFGHSGQQYWLWSGGANRKTRNELNAGTLCPLHKGLQTKHYGRSARPEALPLLSSPLLFSSSLVSFLLASSACRRRVCCWWWWWWFCCLLFAVACGGASLHAGLPHPADFLCSFAPDICTSSPTTTSGNMATVLGNKADAAAGAKIFKTKCSQCHTVVAVRWRWRWRLPALARNDCYLFVARLKVGRQTCVCASGCGGSRDEAEDPAASTPAPAMAVRQLSFGAPASAIRPPPPPRLLILPPPLVLLLLRARVCV
jgi:hypothetical protein